MNHPSPFPYPNRQFTLFPPFSGPDPNSYHSLAVSPPPPISAPVAPDLSATLSNLKSLISLTQQTLASLSNLLPPINQNDSEVPCSFNLHHRMPPESLFSHHLRCPTSIDLRRVVESLNYPKTLKSSDELAKENPFVQALPNPNTELCFTLDDYTDVRESLNFFYKDCPGVVSFPSEDGSTKRTFTLPGSLSAECANFITSDSRETEGLDESDVRIFPSEFWWVRNEVGSWNDYPKTCSYRVVCALSCLGMVKESDLRKFVIVNSPRFGVVIDVALRDHVVVLLNLCLKAIAKEGLSLVKMGSLNMFNCPVLVQVMMWLAAQLSVLYGETNGKFFAIDLLKKCIVDAGSQLLLRSSDQKVGESSGVNGNAEHIDGDASARDAGNVGLEEPVQKKQIRGDGSLIEGLKNRVIFVSQVAAAVAALHERSALEGKIRSSRQSQQLPRYQQLMEHADVSRRAEDERRKRPNYRAIIDHDGLPRQQASMQELNRTKTKEELLAEERDYKRRRMSYRGKKSKRSPSEVLRDIIEEYMEEIKLAGGIGCFEKASAHGVLQNEPPSSLDFKSTDNSELPRGMQADFRLDQVYIDHGSGFNPSDDTYSRYEQPRKYHDRIDSQTRENHKERHGDYYSRSPERSSHGQSRDHIGHRKERNSEYMSRNKYHDLKRSSSDRSSYRQYESSSSRDYIEEDDGKSRSRDRRRRKLNDRYSSDVENAIHDRYDPSRSSDLYEDEGA